MDRAVTRQTLLLEIGTEELPPKALLSLASVFSDGVCNGLCRADLDFTKAIYYATPRRLSVMVSDLESSQKDKEVLRKGPALNVAYDAAGEPTPAALGFAGSCGVALSELEHLETDKGSWLSYPIREKGKATVELIPAIANTALSDLPVPKKMRWGSGHIEFVRPVHWVVALFGTELIGCSILGVKSGRQTFGHRFHSPKAIQLQSALDYLPRLQQVGKVVADFNQRKAIIREAVNKVATEVNGRALLDEALLDEVTALVEWPVAIRGVFDKRFLNLPKEILIATMQDHQRYFPLFDNEGCLLPGFVNITNIESKSPEHIRLGNQRVIVPRLNDAEFFLQQDSKTPLAELQQRLAGVVFQKQLGSLHEKSERLVSLVVAMSDMLGIDKTLVKRAAALSKCDLLTHMVAELPKLQGVMGRYYAVNSGEDPAVAVALEEQYMPRFAGDTVATSNVGQVLAIADKLDTLVGIFAIDQAPTGDNDPFALRRAALGVLRTVIETGLDLDIQDCLQHAVGNYPKALINSQGKDKVLVQVFDFMMDRLYSYYIGQGVPADNFAAVLVCRPTKFYDFHLRLHAVAEFRKLPLAEALIAANKRVVNMLKQFDGQDNLEFLDALLREDAEKKLALALNISKKKVMPLLHDRVYANALSELANLRACIDEFFDNVMVMCDDEALRNNRFALLRQLHDLFLEIADVSRLQQQA